MEIDPKTNLFFLRLPVPHDNIALTFPRLEDAIDVLPILNDDRVYPWMGLPHPHQLEHALNWLKSVKARCHSGQEDLRTAQGGSVTLRFVSECPVRIIREVRPGYESVYLGDCGIGRWRFSDVSDEVQRQLLIDENEQKVVGDPTIVWTIGYYLAPSHSGQGVMSTAIGTLLRWAVTNMNVRHMRTTAMEGNVPSVMVLNKNGFAVQTTLPEFAIKRGEKVGLHVLEWKAPTM